LIERKSHNELLTHLFRQEYTKMTAVLCRHFGLKHFEIAEDIASETFLKASEYWAINGIPDNPTGWLYTVAKNKARDYFKNLSVFEARISNQFTAENDESGNSYEISTQLISDSQLAMIFAVCNPANSSKGQICLALQVLCGFSIEEISEAFLTKTETIKKQLHRARMNLRNDNFQIDHLNKNDIDMRLDVVLKTLYLLFNEGYFSRSNDRQVRRELCSEAMRMIFLLTENPLTNTAQANALLALMCYQSSRLEARTNDKGEPILFEEQDKHLWDKALVDRGNYYLVRATDTGEVSKYHLEAGIAYWHTTGKEDTKWQNILGLYNRLILLEYSQVTALNRTFAFAMVYGCQEALAEAQKLELESSSSYHALLGHLYSALDSTKATEHFHIAISLTKSKAEKQTLSKKVQRLLDGDTSVK